MMQPDVVGCVKQRWYRVYSPFAVDNYSGRVFLCASPCRGNMPLKRRMARAASREDKSLLLDCAWASM